MATRALEGHTADAICCAYHPTDDLVASGSEDGAVLLHDLRSNTASTRLTVSEDEVPSVAFSITEPNHIYACSGSAVHCADLRQAAVLHSRAFNSDEVNSISMSPNGRFLAAADDAGDIKVIDASTWQLFKSMRGAHDSICSSAVFRPHHPWELLTGSLDASVKRWNFSNGRSLRHWQMQSAESDNSSQAFNPPLVHSVAVACPEWARLLGRLVAVARGDGMVAVHDADQAQQPQQHRKATKKGKQAGGNGRCQAGAEEGPRGREADGLVSSLDADAGGHRSGAGCVTFHKASQGKILLSGGNDARVILWPWADSAADSQWHELFGQVTAEEPTAPVAINNHGRNINCVDSTDRSGFNTAVADTSSVLRLYNMV